MSSEQQVESETFAVIFPGQIISFFVVFIFVVGSTSLLVYEPPSIRSLPL